MKDVINPIVEKLRARLREDELEYIAATQGYLDPGAIDHAVRTAYRDLRVALMAKQTQLREET